jgi:hypothetical protein
MLSLEEKKEMWNRVCKEFPYDAMMRDLHMIRELFSALDRRLPAKSHRQLSGLVRQEFSELRKSLAITESTAR